MRSILTAGLALAVGFGLAGCVGKADLEELKTSQKEILAKLEKIEKAPPQMAARPQAPQGPDPAKVYAFPVGEAHVKGPKDAWVTIVEISDFQCPFCNRVTGTLNEVFTTYGNDVRLAFKHNALPFHQRAKPAAMASECAGEQGKFWEMHDKLFANQRALEDTDLDKYASEISLNAGKFKACMTASKFSNKIDEDQRVSQRLGARGTPAFFINGRFLSGAQPFAAFKAIIDEELQKAKASGISKADYYAKAVVEKGAQAM